MKTTISILAIIVLATLLTPSSGWADDDYYYTLDSAISISISDQYIAIQFDSNTTIPLLSQFQETYDCLSEDSVEYIDRFFWAFPLATGCGYTAAAVQIADDSVVARAFPTYRTPSDSVGFRVTDKVIVQFEDNIPSDSALAVLAAEGVRFVDSSAYRHNLWYCALAESITSGPIQYGNRLHERSETRWAYTAQYVAPVLFGTPSDNYFANQYYLNNTGQNGGTVGADIAAVQAWDIPLSDSTFRVAVMDDGLTEHTD
ncbi:MAG: hypothetical protein GF341_04070 [candidate division Zixibacteria bacterium]|nr:hypothetical protein [candidate division Zixibacteria bacterium]